MERRMTPAGEIRIENRADGGKTIVGYGAVFHRDGDAGTEYRLAADIVERIDRRAFDRALKEGQDVRGLFNHDPNFALGSTAAGTMRLSVDDIGLRYEIDHNPDDPQHVSVMQKVQRKDVKGSSFSFRVNGKGGQRFDKGKDSDVRTILDVDLFDAGPVTFPAYSGTTSGFRAEGGEDAIEAHDTWRKEAEAEAVSVRCRRIALDNE